MEDQDFAQIDDELTAEEQELLAVLDLPEEERVRREAETVSEAPDGVPEDSAYFTDPVLDADGIGVTG